MKSSKFCLLSLLISSALVGCNGGGGGGGSTITDDTQPVSYKMENIVENFLNAGIDYKINDKDPKYSGELIKYYDQNHEEVDFRIPTNTVTKYGCVAESIALNNRELNLGSASFNIKPLVNGRHLVTFSSLPKSFINADFGKKICRYHDYNYSGKFIIGSSNQKLVELSNDEHIVNISDYHKFTDFKRLFIVESHTFVDGSEKKLKPYSNVELNYTENEFIVDKNGAVKKFNESTGDYISLPGSAGHEWQFYGDEFLVSKPYGGLVYVYDVNRKELVSGASIPVLQNFDTDLSTSNEVTLSYGIWPAFDGVKDHFGLPFKLLVESDKSISLNLWDGFKWIVVSDVTAQSWYTGNKTAIDYLPTYANSTEDNLYYNPEDRTFVAASSASNGGFDITYGDTKAPQKEVVKDFANHLEGVSLINGKITVETSDRVLNNEKKAFYFIDGDKKQVIGNPGENITSIEPSVHN